MGLSSSSPPPSSQTPFQLGPRWWNYVSALSLAWVFQLMWLSLTKGPDSIALLLLDENRAKRSTAQLGAALRQGKDVTLESAMWAAYGREYALVGLWKLVWAFGTWSSAYYLFRRFLENIDERKAISFLILGSSLISTFSIQQLYSRCSEIAFRVRSALIGLVYEKSLILAPHEVRTGHILTIISTDIEAISDCVSQFHFLWSGVVEVVAIVAISFVIVGVNAFPALAAILITLPFQLYLGYLVSVKSSEWIETSAERVNLMTEIVTAIKLIKFYTYEKYFTDRVHEVRKREAHAAAYQIWLRAANFAIVFGIPVVCTLVVLITVQLKNEKLSVTESFTIVSLFNTLRYPLLMMPLAVKSFASGRNGLENVKKMLGSQELNDSRKLTDVPKKGDDESLVSFDNVSLQWSGTNAPILEDVSFSVKQGEIVAIIGDVGSGKSSLLAAILGQVQIVKGSIKVAGKVSYSAQSAWMLNESIRENITFGSEFDQKRYEKAIRVCNLEHDIANFDEGDQSLVAEGGENLSGGQKQRVSTARAVYNNSDIVLLDDPLSALDQEVGRSVFEECFNGWLRTDKRALIVVTHQLQYLPQCDRVVVMGERGILEYGTFPELMKKDGTLRALITEHTDLRIEEFTEHDDVGPSLRKSRRESLLNPIMETSVAPPAPSPNMSHKQVEVVISEGPKAKRRSSQLTKTSMNEEDILWHDEKYSSELLPYNREMSENGSFRFQDTVEHNRTSVFTFVPLEPIEEASEAQKRLEIEDAYTVNPIWEYLHQGSGGRLGSIILAFFFFGVHAIRLFSDVWIVVWRSPRDRLKSYERDLSLGSESANAGIYVLLVCSFVFGVFLRGHFLAKMTSNRASRLHDDMFQSLLRAPMAFYDRTPLGAILQSCSKHMADADDRLPDSLLQFFQYAPLGMGAFIIMIWRSGNSGELGVAVAIGAVIVILVVAFSSYSRASAHFSVRETSARPALFSHIATSLEGLLSVRAFDAQSRFTEALYDHLDEVAQYQYAKQLIRFWIALHVDIVCSILIFYTANSFARTGATAGSIGLSLSNALQSLVFVQWSLRMWEESAVSFTSVAQLQRVGTCVKSEAAYERPENKPSKGWPTAGLIHFKDVVLHYSKYSPPILKGTNIHIQPREKIGIVGRTGSGKSTLLTALMRIVEVSEGLITIDDVDISKLGLKDLRHHIAIIPQKPVIFGGTVRTNLDPHGDYSDEELWHSLRSVHLDKNIKELPEQLETPLTNTIAGFSQGQCQLFCVARAVLNKSKVVVLDEATAAIDAKTDALVQQAISVNFADCTVLTIAHRLNTLILSDKILVMDSGVVKEFDQPITLLDNPHSSFRSLVNQTGPDTARKLEQLAREQHVKKLNEAAAAKRT